MNNNFDELAKGMAQSVTLRQVLKKFDVGLVRMVLALLRSKATAAPGSDATCARASQQTGFAVLEFSTNATPLKRALLSQGRLARSLAREVRGLGLFLAVLCIANLACAQLWTPSMAPFSPWQAIAASADGSKLVAAVVATYGDICYCSGPPALIYVSTNAGATWTPTTAPLSANAVASSADGTMLAAAYGNGIYTSTNSGSTWTLSGASTSEAWVAVASSANGRRLVAATAPSGFPDGSIYVSGDAGQTWTPTSAPSNVWTSVASSADGTKLAAAAYENGCSSCHLGGIYTSSDGGLTWTKTSASAGPANWSSIASSADGTRLVAADYHRVYTSSDSGQTWAQTSAGTNFAYNNWISVASSADGTRLVASQDFSGGSSHSGVYTSTDSGATWTYSTATPSPFDLTGSTYYYGWQWGPVATSADGYREVAAGGWGTVFGGFICTLPYTGPWRMAAAPANTWSSVAASADGSRLIAANNAGIGGGGLYYFGDGLIYISTNSGASWAPTSVPTNNWTCVASSWDGTRLVASVGSPPGYNGGGLVFISTDSGATWAPTTAPETNWSSVACSADGTRLIAAVGQADSGNAPGLIYVSTNSGATWQPTSAPYTNWNSVACSADATKLAAANETGIWLSTNGGASWFQSTAGFDTWTSIASSADGKILVATAGLGFYFDPSDGYAFGPGGSGQISVSRDAGASWVAATETFSTNSWASVSCSADGTKMVAIGQSPFSSGIVLLSTNSGASWSSAGAPADGDTLLDYMPLAVAVSANGSNIVAAGPGFIFTLQSPPPAPPPPPSPRLSIALSGGNATLSWLVPSVPFVLQRTSELGSTNWVDISLASPPTLNLTNLHYEVTLAQPAGASSQFYRLQQR